MFNTRDIKIALAGRKNRQRQNSNNEEIPSFLNEKYRKEVVILVAVDRREVIVF
jgi:gamma-glutamylcysteine synthetase